ncbi:MAG: universal stress protein [Haloarculaceae archaeon]
MYDTILVPTDGSDPATVAADHALDLAAATGAAVHVLSVVDAAELGLTTPSDVALEEVRSGVRSEAERAVAEVADQADRRGVPVTTAVRVGSPHREILDAGTEVGADLVVMGTHGRTGLAHALLGSTAERVVRQSRVPVLTVRAGEQA